MSKLRYIISVDESKVDVNGNIHRYAAVISTKTGKVYTANIVHDSNLVGEMNRVLGSTWEDVHISVHSDQGIRGVKSLQKHAMFYREKELVAALYKETQAHRINDLNLPF